MNYNDGNKTVNEIVTEVNCNLDTTFYEDTILADSSKGNLILVNKYYYIDDTYKPNNNINLAQNKYSYWSDSYLSNDAYNAFVKLVDDAKELGYSLINTSAHRTYQYQENLYNKSLKNKGYEYTIKSVAKAGHSEHHTGLATDIAKVGVSMYDFGTTKEFEWLKDNAHKYGFILRYPEGKEYLTGYKYEPWHYRYVGVDAATYIYENDILLEEYYAYFCEYKQEC
ncbi:MAG: D-alanyl-D-alanine carboxypeptidase family protein [Firmicutes bacterium]|nr:D-alanyl-D-alanine carboxypeptidase family protein [Bacillota bacterium]